MFDLTGKSALVTGASGGIGGAIAGALVGQGAQVTLTGRRREALEALAGALGERAFVAPADLAEAEGCKAVAREALATMGRVDILVNNAGLTRDALALRMKDADWQAVLDVNLTASFRLARALLPGMVRQRWGRVINVTSVVAATGNPGQTNYAASKAGVVGMSKALAAEVAGRGVTVNCIAPGVIETAMTAGLDDKQRARLSERVPCRRFGTPEDVAACAVFLASEEAAYMTGQTLHVNGGMAMI